MNEHAGPACALSGLIVGVFAVLLHDKIPPPPAPKPPTRDVAITSPAEVPAPQARTSPDLRPGRRPEVVVTPDRPPPVVERRPSIATEVGAQAVAVAATTLVQTPRLEAHPPVAGAGPKAKRPGPTSPRPSFAVVAPGESLADVAARVYGTRDEAESLWKANRDQVERVDSPLTTGTLLRAP